MIAHIATEWQALPAGARAALEQQWEGVVAGGLPCGAAVIDITGTIVATGRNRVYEPAGAVATRASAPLQATRLAHAEMNALALVDAGRDHGELTIWSTQRPCSMCAAAAAFAGIGHVRFVADDPSDERDRAEQDVDRGSVPYEALGIPLWWLVSNIVFLIPTASRGSLPSSDIAVRHPELVAVTMQTVDQGRLDHAARDGRTLVDALELHAGTLIQAVASPWLIQSTTP